MTVDQFRMMSMDARMEFLFGEVNRLTLENSSLMFKLEKRKQPPRGRPPRKKAPSQYAEQ